MLLLGIKNNKSINIIVVHGTPIPNYSITGKCYSIMNNIYYVYAYVRTKDSSTAKAGTPYYIGKGSRNRAYQRHRSKLPIPKDKRFIIFLETNLTNLGALALERRLIKWWGRKDLKTGGILLNRTDGGDGVTEPKYKPKTQEIRAKISLTMSGKIKTEEHRKRLSEANQGKKYSEERKKKMSETSKGRRHSDETKRKLSELSKNKVFTEETRAKISEARKGFKFSDESRKKMSESAKNRRKN